MLVLRCKMIVVVNEPVGQKINSSASYRLEGKKES